MSAQQSAENGLPEFGGSLGTPAPADFPKPPAENVALGRVDFTCEWCGGRFTYQPGLMGSGLGVRITVDRIGDECVRHRAGLVTTVIPPATTEGGDA